MYMYVYIYVYIFAPSLLPHKLLVHEALSY